MNTAPLQNPANILSSLPAAAKPNDVGAAQTPFNQVLSDEVAQRRAAADDDSKANAGPVTGANDADHETCSGTPTGKAEDKAAADDAAPVSASADLLALVANLQRGDGTTATPATTAVSATTKSITAAAPITADGGADGAATSTTDKQLAASGVDLDLSLTSPKKDVGAALAGSKIDPAADGTARPGQAAGPVTDAAPKPEAGFAVVIRQASQAQTGPDQSLLKNLDAGAPAATPAAVPLAAGIVPASQGMPAQAADKLTPQVGTPAWDSALGQKIVWMAAGTQQSASLTLNPPDLGPLQVVLHVTNSHANATFICAQAEVRQALEAAMPRLREMMNEAGIQLGQANVNTGTPNQPQTHGEAAAHSAVRGVEGASMPADAPLHSRRAHELSTGRSLVDTFA